MGIEKNRETIEIISNEATPSPYAHNKGKNPRALGIGRKKGTKNKVNQLTESVKDKCLKMGFDPFLELMKLTTMEYEPAIRLGALRELCHYVSPKLKSIQVTDVSLLALVERAKQLAELPKEELQKLAIEGLSKIDEQP